MKPGVLYISYDGMLEPLGQSQVVAYLERLASGRRIHLISFEKASDWNDRERRSMMERRLADAGIRWHPLRYHKSPTAPATAYDITAGTALGLALALRHRLSIVHARSYVAAAMALPVKRVTGAQFLFDMRGLWADERVDGGLWPKDGRLYRITKALEQRFLEAADHVVTLTHASEREIRSFPYLERQARPISVIPTCADLDRFRIQGPPQREPFVLGYVGSVGTWHLLDELLQFFTALRRQREDARLLFVNRNEQELIPRRASECGIASEALEIAAAEHRDVPRHIARMSAGIALYRATYSGLGRAPTKLGEYLGCGVPCMGNAGVGDVESILEGKGVGVVLQGFSSDSVADGVKRLLALTDDPGIQDRCRNVATELFSLDAGVDAYNAIYDQLSPKLERTRAA